MRWPKIGIGSSSWKANSCSGLSPSPVRSRFEVLVVDGTRRWFDGGKGAVVVEAGFAPGDCLAFVAAGSVVAEQLLFPADTEWNK